MKHALVTGATGFVGHALLPRLVEAGFSVRALSRRYRSSTDAVEWQEGDLSRQTDVERALEGIDVVYFLVHGMTGSSDYAAEEASQAELMRDMAARHGVKRIVYLGGVEPQGEVSAHLKSRLAVGEILRAGSVRTIELRASMIIGKDSASWRIVRDLALRLPVRVLPSWTKSRTCPVALDDVIGALINAATITQPASAAYDIPGPQVLTGEDMLTLLTAMKGRAVPNIRVPVLTPQLSAHWLRFVSRGDIELSEELVQGFKSDLLPRDEEWWHRTKAPPRKTFEQASLEALAEESEDLDAMPTSAAVLEAAVAVAGRAFRSIFPGPGPRQLQPTSDVVPARPAPAPRVRRAARSKPQS